MSRPCEMQCVLCHHRWTIESEWQSETHCPACAQAYVQRGDGLAIDLSEEQLAALHEFNDRRRHPHSYNDE